MRKEIAARRRLVYSAMLKSKPAAIIADELNIDLFTVNNDINYLSRSIGKIAFKKKDIQAFILRVKLATEKIEALIYDAQKQYDETDDPDMKLNLRNQIVNLEKFAMQLIGDTTLSKLRSVTKKIKNLE